MPSLDKHKVALLFGSFNPIHEGHLAIVKYINDRYPDVEVRLVVSPQSPFKDGLMASAEKRLAAVREEVGKSGLKVKVSDVEFGLKAPLYTINTLRYMRETEPFNEFILVMGGDNIESVNKWYDSEALMAEFRIWVYPRFGYDAEKWCRFYNSIPGTKGVTLFEDARLNNISSTQIRRGKDHYNVIIIGGGITGAGIARDCALRGIRTLLLEKADFTNGATGRNHGLLHSGARYAVGDSESAEECIKENIILKKIASSCIERTDGLFLSLPEDDPEYQKKFIESCKKAGIAAQAIDPSEARRLEPSVNPAITGAVRVPDGSVDPFRLTMANIQDAKAHGAQVRTYTEVVSFIKDRSKVIGLNVINKLTGEGTQIYADIVVNAAGIWGASIAEKAGAHVGMYPAKGTLLVFGHRVNNIVLNRCRKSADGDILVPGESVSIIGTTSTRVAFEEVDSVSPTPQEVDLLLKEGAKLAPELMQTRILRAYSGVRPLVASDDDPTGRNISRGIVLLDHEERDGIKGLITITGGKLMTYRLMAEKTTNLICKKFALNVPCTTDKVPLPDPLRRNPHFGGKLVCECENVTEHEIRKAVDELGAVDLLTLRRRTRLGMGTCQGQLCARRAAGMLDSPDLEGFMRERWKGIYPVAWGDTLREAQLTQWIYKKDHEV